MDYKGHYPETIRSHIIVERLHNDVHSHQILSYAHSLYYYELMLVGIDELIVTIQ